MDKRVEIISMVERRRQWPAEEKLRIMEEALVPGATIAAVSRGRLGGRPKVNAEALVHAKAMIKGGMSTSQAAKLAEISRSTLYRTQ